MEKDVDNARHEHGALPIHTNHHSHFHFVSHIQATVNADFIPCSINDWSSNSDNDMSQRDIDIMISDPCRGVASDNCDLDTEEAETNWEIIAIIVAALIGVIFMVGCFAGCYMCVCKLGANKTV